MGNNTKRTFDENVEMIADCLAQIVERQDKLIAIAERNSDHICRRGDTPAPEVPAETPTADAVPGASAEPAMTYEQLKFALIQRGVEIPKGTKMTTLLKLWDKHKFDDLKAGATTSSGVEASAAGAGLVAAPAEEVVVPGGMCVTSAAVPPPPPAPPEVAASTADDLFGEPASAAPKAEPMTREQAVKALSALFHDPALPEERDLMLAKVAEFGVPHFRDIPEAKLGEFVAAVKAALK